jgi:hypothetical protein
MTCAILALWLCPGPAPAAEHLVASTAIAEQFDAAAAARQRAVRTVQRVLSTRQAASAAKALGVGVEELRDAVPKLSDRELNELAVRAARLDADPVSGHLDADANDFLVVFLLVAIVAVVLAAAR